MKFGQLKEYNMRNIFLEKSVQSLHIPCWYLSQVAITYSLL